MKVVDDIALDLEVNMKSARMDEATLGAARLRNLDPHRWYSMLSDSTLDPLVSIRDSVLQDVTIIVQLQESMKTGLQSSDENDIASAAADLTRLKASFVRLQSLVHDAGRWLEMTATERWLQRLFEATEKEDLERERIIKMLAMEVVRNENKRAKIAALEAEFKELRKEARNRLEARWEARHSHTRTLNEQQKKAVSHNEGRLVITAGPGSGKTHVLVERMASLIETGCSPERILMLTFTVKATSEMKERVQKRLEGIANSIPHVINFNSFCKECIDEDPEGFGFSRTPVHVAPGLRHFLVEDLMESEINDKIKSGLERPSAQSLIPGLDGMVHNQAKEPDDIAKQFKTIILDPLESMELAAISSGIPPSEELEFFRDIYNAMTAVQPMRNLIRDRGGLTFGDQITLFHKRLIDSDAYLDEISKRYDHVLVDEFQDNNLSQGEIVHRLSERMVSTCVVGDADQAIYHFRGANVRNISEFLEKFEENKVSRIDLDIGYRHSQKLIDLGENLIARHPDRLNRPHVRTGWINDDFTEVQSLQYFDSVSECCETVNWLLDRHLRGYEWDEMAILTRSIKHVEPLLNLLEKHDIPFVSTSSDSLFQDSTTRFAGLLLRACLDPVNQGHALHMLLHEGAFGVLREDATILGYKARGAQHLHSVLVSMEGDFQNPGSLREAIRFFDNHQLVDQDLTKWMFTTLRDAGLVDMMLAKGPDHPMAILLEHLLREIEIAGRLLTNHTRFARLIEQMMEGRTELDIKEIQRPGHLLVSTIHQSKGLEWKIVVMAGMDVKKRPPPTLLDKAKRKIMEDLFDEDPVTELKNEKLRVLYVGATRAIDILRLSYHIQGDSVKERKPNALMESAIEIFGIETIAVLHPSLTGQPITTDQLALVEMRKLIDEKIRTLEHGNEASNIKSIIRGILAYQLERMVVEGRPLTPNLKIFIDEVEKLTGPITLNLVEPVLASTPGSKSSNLQITRYSWSMIESYRKCPQQFRFRYIHRIKTPSNKAATTGIIVHEALEALVKPPPPVTEEVIDSILNKIILSHVNRIPMLSETQLSEIRKYIQIWGNSESAGNDVLGVEIPISFNFEGRPFTGKIDRVEYDSEGRLRLIDFKTGKPRKKPGDKGMEQLLLYAHGWREMNGKLPESIVLDHVMHETTLERDINPLILERGLARLTPILEGIDHGPWDATPDYGCKYCDYRSLCPQAKL